MSTENTPVVSQSEISSSSSLSSTASRNMTIGTASSRGDKRRENELVHKKECRKTGPGITPLLKKKTIKRKS